jgi:hypothetical protein
VSSLHLTWHDNPKRCCLALLCVSAGIPNNTRVSSGGGDGFDLNEVMDYVGKALSSGNADVRAAALRVAVAVAGCAAGGGAAVRRLLPKDLNPKLREQADAALGGDLSSAAGPAAGEANARKEGRNQLYRWHLCD